MIYRILGATLCLITLSSCASMQNCAVQGMPETCEVTRETTQIDTIPKQQRLYDITVRAAAHSSPHL